MGPARHLERATDRLTIAAGAVRSRLAVVCAAALSLLGCQAGATAQSAESGLADFLEPCSIRGIDGHVLCGTYEVWEDRDAQEGRRIGLNIVVLRARDPRPELGAFAVLAGGPGAAATSSARGYANSWQRRHHDILLIDQRGTGQSNPLGCDLSRPGDTAQAYLDAPFGRLGEFEACRDALSEEADLTLYTTPIAMDDLNEVRAALGYELLNVTGASYGSRAALVYMRRHPETVRTAVINGVAPIAFTNPLYHSSEAQKALDRTFAQCADDVRCATAFPDLSQKFDELMARLQANPARVTVTDPDTGEPVEISLTWSGFAESLRVFTYYMPRARRVPSLIHRAWQGNYTPFVEAGISSTRGIDAILQIGMLLSVTCAEDVARIDPAAIADITDRTYLGDERVRTQMAVCAIWPQGRIPDSYGDPVRADVPVLVLSGTLDPVTGPSWGEEAARHLPNSLHLVIAGAHGVRGPCTRSIMRSFVDAGTLEGLDTLCVENVTLPPFAIE